jgi:hypothetical protein
LPIRLAPFQRHFDLCTPSFHHSCHQSDDHEVNIQPMIQVMLESLDTTEGGTCLRLTLLSHSDLVQFSTVKSFVNSVLYTLLLLRPLGEYLRFR